MICPVCKKPMLTVELQRVEIDYCPDCSGIWLDQGELELLATDDATADNSLGTIRPVISTDEKKYRCPVCSKKMNKVFIGNEKNIIIDQCRKGHGFWFDKGELQEIIKTNTKPENKILDVLNKMFSYQLKKQQ